MQAHLFMGFDLLRLEKRDVSRLHLESIDQQNHNNVPTFVVRCRQATAAPSTESRLTAGTWTFGTLKSFRGTSIMKTTTRNQAMVEGKTWLCSATLDCSSLGKSGTCHRYR